MHRVERAGGGGVILFEEDVPRGSWVDPREQAVNSGSKCGGGGGGGPLLGARQMTTGAIQELGNCSNTRCLR